jgi:DNA-binding MarR family transcriptional regulator
MDGEVTIIEERAAVTNEGPGRDPTQRSGPLRELVTMRMVILFGLLRRSGVLAQRRHFDLSELEWRVITQVAEFAPLSLNGLAELLVQDRGQLSRTIKGMAERGLLTRERKPGGPEIVIELSKEGRALHSRMIERAIERDRILTQDIPPEDIAAFWRVLDRMIGHARIMMDEERKLGAAQGRRSPQD